MLTIILGIIASVILAVLSVAVAYLYFLALIGTMGNKSYPEISKSYDFLILVPAHNRSRNIHRTLESLVEVEPIGHVEIAVIANNCTDNTVEIAREYDVTVLERFDDAHQGKGYALEWTISQYDLDRFQAVAVVDAGTIVERNMLRAMAESFESGADAVQLYYGLVAEQQTGLPYLQKILNITENLFFYKGRAALGLSILLRGTGMAIKSKVLEDHPWQEHSITANIEYSIKLIIADKLIDFNVNSMVLAETVSSIEQSHRQKLRWASGTLELMRKRLWPLCKLGISQSRIELVELGFSFILLNHPFRTFLTITAIILALPAHHGTREVLLGFGLVLIALQVIYSLSGILFIREKKQALKSLLHIPGIAWQSVIVQFRTLIEFGKNSHHNAQ
jgi:cellulose synthase/poly-beta-1,6-N-acetylglucosamine synthase-like glycosyltransferase